MLLRKSATLFKNFSTQTKSSLKWRNQIKQNQIISQISTLLLQRQDWIPLMQNLNLSSKLTPNIFTQVLLKTEQHPEISLNFFNWAKSNLGFKPDLKSHCKLIQILLNSKLSQSAKPLLNFVAQSQPVSVFLDSMIQTCKEKETQHLAFDFILEFYSNKGLVSDGLEIFRRIGVLGLHPVSAKSCNTLLDLVQRKNELKMARCLCAAIVRCNVPTNSFTWSLVARIFCKQEKLGNAVKLLNWSAPNPVIYNLVIDCYCKKGDFTNAMECLKDMYSKNLTPGFRVYSSILDGACRVEDALVIETIIREMGEKKLIAIAHVTDYNTIIQKLCELGRSYAAEMFFVRATNEKSELQGTSYGHMLRAFCEEGRVKEAMGVYRVVVEKGMALDIKCYRAFANVVCKEEPSEAVDTVLKDVISKGYIPCGKQLTTFIASQCRQCRWIEAEGLLNVILERRLLPESLCCSSLVEHYCANGQIDKAIALHEKMEKLGGHLDVATYNVLLVGLFKERKSEIAVQMFDYMRRCNVVSSGCFSIMITGLCCEREMRKAMKLHDDMLKMGLKPDKAIYRRLISKFI